MGAGSGGESDVNYKAALLMSRAWVWLWGGCRTCEEPWQRLSLAGEQRGLARGMGLAEGALVEMELLHVQVKPHSLSFSPLYPFSALSFCTFLL